VKKLAILKVQRVILTVFTLFTFLFSDFIQDSARHAGKTTKGIMLGWSDRHGFRGNALGSLQPYTVFCPCLKSIVVSCATSVSPRTSVHCGGERNGEPHGEPRLSCTVHPSTPEKRLRFVAIGTYPLLKRPRKRKNAKEGFGPELQESVGSVLMVENPSSPPYLLGNIQKGKGRKIYLYQRIFPRSRPSNEGTTRRKDRKRNSSVLATL